MTHICPACGKKWECECPDAVKAEHREIFGEHAEEIACSEKCGEQLRALITFLAQRVKWSVNG